MLQNLIPALFREGIIAGATRHREWQVLIGVRRIEEFVRRVAVEVTT